MLFLNCCSTSLNVTIPTGTGQKLGKNQATTPQTGVARSITIKDVIAALEREPQMSKSPLLYCLYEKTDSDVLAK